MLDKLSNANWVGLIKIKSHTNPQVCKSGLVLYRVLVVSGFRSLLLIVLVGSLLRLDIFSWQQSMFILYAT